MKNNYDICIIGGGASGLFCGTMIKRKNPNLSVAILEKQRDIGRKLLATGNGRCNLTNINASEEMYHGTFQTGIIHLLDFCPPETLIDLFSHLGLLTTCDKEGRVYPYSKHSASVLGCLRLHCENVGVKIFNNSYVTSVSKDKNTYKISCKENKDFICNNIVIASGSKATPETGADDSILYSISKEFNHNFTPPTPALCPIHVKSDSLFSLKGIRVNGKVSIFVNGKKVKSESGEIQFAEKALSGICIFNLSRIANKEKNAVLSLSLLPHLTEQEIFLHLKRQKSHLTNDLPAEELLCGIFQRKLNLAILKEAKIKKDRTVATISDKDLQRISHLINNWEFPVIAKSDFTRAQVVAGGINGKEINPYTMESKYNKNMYFIGEAIDCDGDCGGFNLQFAFSSAYCAACELTK